MFLLSNEYGLHTILSFVDDDVRQVFKKYGAILDIRHFKAQGYSFVRFDSKDAATKAIMDMNGGEFMGQSIRCSWGKTEASFVYYFNEFSCFYVS